MAKFSKILWLTALFTTLMVTLAIIGGIKNYSPVPYWDMWDGTVHFILNLNDGYYAAWWPPHNEHWIILSRVLFWLDYRYFGGLSYFLIIVNYLLVSASAYLFWRILRALFATHEATTEQIILGLFITSWLFQWMQSENLTWGFQSQFFLAQLLPLCAFYWLYQSTVKLNSSTFFIACALGFASIGTMANGIIALPLMTAYALITRQKPLRIGILAVLSLITLYAYLHNPFVPLKNSFLYQDLTTQPLNLLYFILLYLGNPFYYLCGHATFGHISAVIAAVFFIASALRFTRHAFQQTSHAHLKLMLFSFILYIGATALGTAEGRMDYGFDQALSSRYTTPVLMAWAALLLLYAPLLVTALKAQHKKTSIPLVVMALLMLGQQSGVFKSKQTLLFKKNVAALALALGIDDQQQISAVYPVAKNVLPIAAQAVDQNLSIFGTYPLRGIKALLGTTLTTKAYACQGHLDSITPVDTRFSKVSGKLVNASSFIYLLNNQSKIIGYARAGQFKAKDHKNVLISGFQGYVLSDQLTADFYLQTKNLNCQLTRKPLKTTLYAP